MIEVEGLTKRYGDLTAIQDLTFQVQAGEVVGFLGVNGAGKTTTLRILGAYQPASSGKARVAGHDVFSESLAVRRQIGYLPESVPLYEELRVTEYLHFRARIKGVERARRKAEVDRVIERCKLPDRRRQTIGTLSRGYRQRVGLADALLGPPKILLLDEPTSGLDPMQRLEVRALLLELAKDQTVLLSTHILGEVEATCSRVIILHQGKLVPEDEVKRLRSRACFEIQCKGPERKVEQALLGLEGVAAVRPATVAPGMAPAQAEPDTHRLEVDPAPGQDPRDGLVKLFADRQGDGWRLLELKARSLTLEEVFAQATQGSNPIKEGGA